MTAEFSVEHVTDRGHRIRFASWIDWDGNTAIDVTALPGRWYTNHPADLRRLAAMVNDAADWLEANASACSSPSTGAATGPPTNSHPTSSTYP